MFRSAAQNSLLQGQQGALQSCTLTWYDPAQGGINSASGKPDPHSPTASGEPYDPKAFTCAAPPKYAFGTNITFFYQKNQVTCRVNDRGSAIQGSHFDLSLAAADSLGISSQGRVTASFKVGGSAGAPASANDSAGGPGGVIGAATGLGSVIDLLTQPIDTLGGWLAGIAVNLTKDVVIGIADVIIIPFWHWNQRATIRYWKDLTADRSGEQLLWTGVFWGTGYWLLFTDPNQGNLKPAPVRNSRVARHARFAQSVPARQSLVKPKHVKEKTPKKPKPVISKAIVTQTGTMQAYRQQAVKVTGTHARAASRIPVTTENEREVQNFRDTLPPQDGRNRPSLPHSQHRARTPSLPDSRGRSEGRPG